MNIISIVNKRLVKPGFLYNGYSLVLFIIVPALLCFQSCKKSDSNTNIPYVNVQLYISLTLPEYSSLNSPGNSIAVSGGAKGIIIYRMTMQDFKAYDRSCPYDPLVSGAIVEIDSNRTMSVDRHCGSKFYLTDGSIYHGPATRPLKQYVAEFDDATQTVYIHN